MTNKLIVKDPFEMPAVDDTTVLVLRECADLVPHCWIWNESVGYLEVVTYSGYDIYVTVKNVGMKENATSGTIFPSCMEFLITAPNATPIIDNTVTCLRADFKCPTVGQEALMSVDSTSAIRVGDIIIVDTRYQYLVTEIINEHTMKVLNEEKGKEGGVIDVKCNECVPVKILESTHCCEALQDQVDDIYNRIDTKKSVVSNNILLSVDHGIDAIPDVSYDIELDIDTDLSKYDNSVSKFTSLRYFKENTAGVNAFFNPDRSTGYTNYDLGTNTNYFDTAYINEIHGGQGRSSFISFPIDGSDTMYSNGTTFSYNAHAFYSGGKKLVAFAHDEAYFHTPIIPAFTSTYDLGDSSTTWNNIYTDSITLNGTTYTSIPTVNDATLDIQKNGTSVGTFTANASSNSTINITVPTDTTDLTNGAGYITSASLPTVNDATLTIYNSDGVTPFVTFTANASSAVTATLPASGNTYTATSPISIDANNDISISQATTSTDGYLSSTDWNTFNSKASAMVYFEEDLSGTTAVWQPKSGSATTYELGVNNLTDTFSKAYIDELHIRGMVNDLGNTTIRISSDTALAPGGSSSGGTLNTVDLGGVDYPFTNLYTKNIHIYNGTELKTGYNYLSPVSDNIYTLGYSNSYKEVRSHAFTNTSDIRLKKNINDYKDNALDKINNLHPITYNTTTGDDTEIKLGLSAQELQEQEPLCVSVDKGETKSDENYLGVNLYSLITLCLKGIKELSAEVKELKSKLGEKDANSEVLEK